MKLRMMSVAAACAFPLLMTLSQGVQAREFADIYTECGLGAIIAPNNGAVAAVTNVTWDLGTTAISSNASSEDNCKGGKPKTASLILESYPQIETELARGQGVFVTAMLTAAGCQSAVHAPLARAVRADLSAASATTAYGVQTRYQQAETMYNALQRRIDSEYAGACQQS